MKNMTWYTKWRRKKKYFKVNPSYGKKS